MQLLFLSFELFLLSRSQGTHIHGNITVKYNQPHKYYLAFSNVVEYGFRHFVYLVHTLIPEHGVAVLPLELWCLIGFLLLQHLVSDEDILREIVGQVLGFLDLYSECNRLADYKVKMIE